MNVIAIILVTVALICGQAEPEITPQYNYTIWQNQLETFQTIARRQDEVIKNQTEMINDLGKRMDQLMNNLTVISTDTKKYMKESSDNAVQSLRNQNWYLHKVIEDMEAKQNNKKEPDDCAAIYKQGKTWSGVYTISVQVNEGSTKEMSVRCHGRGWTVIQRRFDGSVKFSKNWSSYRSGFGSPDGEYWLGNDNLHLLTSSKTYHLLVELTDHDDNKATAMYENFTVSDESDKYRMTVGTFLGGTAGDSLSYHNGMEFSTYDNDNDKNSGSCSQGSNGGRGGWWYKNCDHANVNGGVYHTSPASDDASIEWNAWLGSQAMKGSIMAIRPKNF